MIGPVLAPEHRDDLPRFVNFDNARKQQALRRIAMPVEFRRQDGPRFLTRLRRFLAHDFLQTRDREMTDLQEHLLLRVAPETAVLVLRFLAHRLRGVSDLRENQPGKKQRSSHDRRRRRTDGGRRGDPRHFLHGTRETGRRRLVESLRPDERFGKTPRAFHARCRVSQRRRKLPDVVLEAASRLQEPAADLQQVTEMNGPFLVLCGDLRQQYR